MPTVSRKCRSGANSAIIRLPINPHVCKFYAQKMKGTHASLSRRVPRTHKDWLLPIHLSNLWPHVRRNSGHCCALITCTRRAVSMLLYLLQERHRTMFQKTFCLIPVFPPSHSFNRIHRKNVWRSFEKKLKVRDP